MQTDSANKQECRQQAEKSISPLDKEAWLRAAAEYVKIAQIAEERDRGSQL